MDVRTVDLPACADAAATAEAVVIIDVLRACTTAATAFARGARALIAVRGVAEARRLATRLPTAVLAGEVDGLPVPGFDLPNSPSVVAGAELQDRVVVHRTTAGTHGLVEGRAAPLLLAAGFVNASATAARLRAEAPRTVALVVTGSHSADRGDEDRALADYLTRVLHGEEPDPTPYLVRVQESAAARKFGPSGPLRDYRADVDHSARLDVFDFAMQATRGPDGYPILAAAPSPETR